MKLFVALSLGILLTACHPSEIEKDDNKSNIHMNKMSFEEMTERFESSERKDWQKPDIVIEKLGDLSKKTVGDIGAGTGYFSFRLAEQAAKVVAIDVDKRFIKFIEAKKTKNKIDNLTTRLVPYDNPSLSENEFDALLIVNTYHHFNNKLAYLNLCRQGLQDGGTLLVVDFKNRKTAHGPPLNHRISPEKIKIDLESAGFVQIEIDTISLPYQYIITAKK